MRGTASVGLLLAACLGFTTGTTLAQEAPSQPITTENLGKLLRDMGYEPRPLSREVFQVTVERDRWPVHIMLSLSTDAQRVWLESKFAPIEQVDKVPALAWQRLLEANDKIGPAHFAFDRADKRVHLFKSFDNTRIDAARIRREVDTFDAVIRKTQDFWRAENFYPADRQPSVEVTPLPERPGVEARPVPFVPRPEVKSIPTARPNPDPKVAIPEIPLNVPIIKSPETEVKVAPIEKPVIQDSERCKGVWKIIEIQVRGKKTPEDVLAARQPSMEFTKDGAILKITEGERRVKVRMDSRDQPHHIDFIDEQDRVEKGIYKFDGDTLTVCFGAPGEPRPKEFLSLEDSRTWVIVLRKK